jgi:hypothetical protein
MVTFKYTYDRYNRCLAINASASPTYNGVKTELEARVALARKLDCDIAAQKAKMEKEIAELTQELNDLEGLRNSVYVGELPPVPVPT